MYILKRDGTLVPYDVQKIGNALHAAIRDTIVNISDVAFNSLLNSIHNSLVSKAEHASPLSIETIQDIVEVELMKHALYKTAQAYIKYREQHRKLRVANTALVDSVLAVREYVERADWRVNANANQGYSLGGMILNISGKITANYWLNEVYTENISEAHRNADIHIHDIDMLAGYCAGWSLRTLLNEGFNGVSGKVESAPPAHLSSATGQMVNFLGTLQNEWAGAQAFSSFDTYLAPFVRKDSLEYKEVRQCIQEFVYNLNVPSRWGGQPPFTNITFDWVCPDDLKTQIPVIAGVEMPFSYGDLQTEMDMINAAYIDVMMTGDAKGRIFSFPIPTYNITPDFPWESDNAKSLFEMTAKYGLPYFQNFINSELKPNMVRSMCCRLQLDLRQLLKRGNGLFGSAEQTGSIGVVTINCARIGFTKKGDTNGLYARLGELLCLAKDSLEVKRKVIQRHIDNGFYPYTKRYLGTLRNHFSTIGINGVNEMIRNFTDDAEDITTAYGHKMALDILDYVRTQLLDFQNDTGHMYNMEATPAEGTTYRFAKEDKKRYPTIFQAGTPDAPYYTNSSQLPVNFTDDPFTALEMQEDIQSKYTGGTVLHLYMGEKISDATACKKLVKASLERFRLPYITVTPTFSICQKHGYIAGEHEFCPKCDEILITRKITELSQKTKQRS